MKTGLSLSKVISGSRGKLCVAEMVRVKESSLRRLRRQDGCEAVDAIMIAGDVRERYGVLSLEK